MKSQALQNLVKSIFSNEETKTQFISNPNSVLSRFNLTKREKTAVLKTHAKLGLATGDSPTLEASIDPLATWV